MSRLTILFDGQTADASSASHTVRGGPLSVFADGEFAGSRILVQWSPDGGTTWYDDPLIFREKGFVVYTPSPSILMRVTLQNSTANTDVNCSVIL